MRISEIFYSVQGEGELTGVPSVFVRTSGCNLRCAWCDTPYASWHPEGQERSVSEILEEVNRHPTDFVVVTGGEPMIAKGIHELAAGLRAAGKHITIETAASVAPGGIACDLASLSPKMSNSTPSLEQAGPWRERHEKTRSNPAVIAEWLGSYPFQLKFVVSSTGDLREIEALLGVLPVPVPSHKVLLMPQGITPAELATRTPWLVDVCKTHGYRFCARLHIDLFGNTPGT
jgi:7-carboxy-7-deazaguanine synthase